MNAPSTAPNLETGSSVKISQEKERLRIQYLEVDLLLRNEEANRVREEITARKHKRWIGWGVALVAGVVPLLVLLFLVYQVHLNPGAFLNGDISGAVFISASFLSFIVIYAVLIKGMFPQGREDDKVSPIKDSVDILREHRPGGD